MASKWVTAVAGALHWLVPAYLLTTKATLKSKFICVQHLHKENYLTFCLGITYMITKVIPAA